MLSAVSLLRVLLSSDRKISEDAAQVVRLLRLVDQVKQLDLEGGSEIVDEVNAYSHRSPSCSLCRLKLSIW